MNKAVISQAIYFLDSDSEQQSFFSMILTKKNVI